MATDGRFKEARKVLEAYREWYDLLYGSIWDLFSGQRILLGRVSLLAQSPSAARREFDCHKHRPLP
jgi:hypothetical protein